MLLDRIDALLFDSVKYPEDMTYDDFMTIVTEYKTYTSDTKVTLFKMFLEFVEKYRSDIYKKYLLTL